MFLKSAACSVSLKSRGRTSWMQKLGRAMRPLPGKAYGIGIDRTGAVHDFGYPDEDFPWLLNGDNDAEWEKKKMRGETKDTNYCKFCELVYPKAAKCPQCGRAHARPSSVYVRLAARR